jgi:hypothetical protein
VEFEAEEGCLEECDDGDPGGECGWCSDGDTRGLAAAAERERAAKVIVAEGDGDRVLDHGEEEVLGHRARCNCANSK